eukprot:TRINITY_DN696_c1_g1_i1.p1 TRINITY_DN696_c1_g1~~TRINITY_DN696_c1_g1_i1.p1  ORF type:complete len:638 (+),score=51.08 TRINITY_DN696_c1_g1_i1:26-1915(+)
MAPKADGRQRDPLADTRWPPIASYTSIIAQADEASRRSSGAGALEDGGEDGRPEDIMQELDFLLPQSSLGAFALAQGEESDGPSEMQQFVASWAGRRTRASLRSLWEFGMDFIEVTPESQGSVQPRKRPRVASHGHSPPAASSTPEPEPGATTDGSHGDALGARGSVSSGTPQRIAAEPDSTDFTYLRVFRFCGSTVAGFRCNAGGWHFLFPEGSRPPEAIGLEKDFLRNNRRQIPLLVRDELSGAGLLPTHGHHRRCFPLEAMRRVTTHVNHNEAWEQAVQHILQDENPPVEAGIAVRPGQQRSASERLHLRQGTLPQSPSLAVSIRQLRRRNAGGLHGHWAQAEGEETTMPPPPEWTRRQPEQRRSCYPCLVAGIQCHGRWQKKETRQQRQYFYITRCEGCTAAGLNKRHCVGPQAGNNVKAAGASCHICSRGAPMPGQVLCAGRGCDVLICPSEGCRAAARVEQSAPFFLCCHCLNIPHGCNCKEGGEEAIFKLLLDADLPKVPPRMLCNMGTLTSCRPRAVTDRLPRSRRWLYKFAWVRRWSLEEHAFLIEQVERLREHKHRTRWKRLARHFLKKLPWSSRELATYLALFDERRQVEASAVAEPLPDKDASEVPELQVATRSAQS